MVSALGHLGMALIWLAPLWFVVDDPETAALGIAGGFWFGVWPDVDIVISKHLSGVHHHGVFHTVLVASLFAVAVGPLFGLVLATAASRIESRASESRRRYLALGVAIVWVAGLAHVFADVLSAPDIASPVEPFWPLVDGRIGTIDVFYYTDPVVNWGLLLIGLGLNVALWYRTGLWRGEATETPFGRF